MVPSILSRPVIIRVAKAIAAMTGVDNERFIEPEIPREMVDMARTEAITTKFANLLLCSSPPVFL